MDNYRIVILFSSDKAHVDIVDDKAFSFLYGNDAFPFSTRVFMDQAGVKVLVDDDEYEDIDALKDKYKDCDYIDNVLVYVYEHYIQKNGHSSSKSLEIFAQYIHYIIDFFVEMTEELFSSKVSNIRLSIATPRIWGYHINETDVCTVIAKSGLTQDITIYNDLNLRVECYQEDQDVGRLRTCLFCTLFLEPGLSLFNSVVTFFSGSFHDELYQGLIKPVNGESLPPVSVNIDVVGLYTRLRAFIATKIQDLNIHQEDEAVGDCLSLIVQILRENMYEDTENKRIVDFKELLLVQDKRSNEEQLEEDCRDAYEGTEAGDTTLILEALKDVSIQDIYTIFETHLEQFICAFQSTLQRCEAREVFLELFRTPYNVDKKYVDTALISIYFTHHALKQRNDIYVHIYFTNFLSELDEEGNDYSLQTTLGGYFDAINCDRFYKKISEPMGQECVTIEGNVTPLCQGSENEDQMNYVININLSLDRSQIYVLKKIQENEEFELCDGINIIVEPFEALKSLYLKQRGSRKSVIVEDLQDFDDFDVYDIQGKFHYYPERLSTFEDIIYAMHKIEFHNQSLKYRVLFGNHSMKILLTLYVMHINEKLSMKDQFISFVVILDPLFDEILGRKQSLVRYFAREFGLFSDDEDVKKKMVIYKKNRAHVLKLQEDPIFSNMPFLENFLQVQITRTHFQGTCYKMFAENKKIPPTKIESLSTDYSFYDKVVENLWCYIYTSEQGTLMHFETFKVQMDTYLEKLFLLKLDDDVDSISQIFMDNNTLVEFSHRTLIEVAINPVVEEIASFIIGFLLYFDRLLWKPWHMFLMLEDFTGKGVALETNLLHQVIKFKIKNQMTMFYDSNINFDRSDYSIADIRDVDLCFINSEPLGHYSLITGKTHLHLTFNTSYAIKFFLEGDTTEGLTVYETGSFFKHKQQSEKKLDLNTLFIFAKEGEKSSFEGNENRFRIQNDTDGTIAMYVYRVLGPVDNENADVFNFDHQLVSTFNFTKESFDSEEYRACPMVLVTTCHTLKWTLCSISISTPSIGLDDSTIQIHEPFKLCYSG